jgi:hypothetical protein
MITDLKHWHLTGAASDFNLVTINRQHVVMARRMKHDKDGVDVTLLGQGKTIRLTTTFAEFDAWLNREGEAPPRPTR